MNTRLTVPLDQAEREALHKAAQAEMRPLREQARWLIRQELERRGLLTHSITQHHQEEQ
jgi:hypothetical protein